MDIDSFIDTENPPPPQEVPPQWFPAIIRWPLRLFCLPFILLDLSMQKLARLLIPPPYKKEGTCKKRGNCCYYILIRKPKGPLGALFAFWNTQVNGFYIRDNREFTYEGKPVMAMGCRYLKKDGSCAHYRLRPLVCRKWPVIEHFGTPRILKGCGFKAVPKRKKDPLSILKD